VERLNLPRLAPWIACLLWCVPLRGEPERFNLVLTRGERPPAWWSDLAVPADFLAPIHPQDGTPVFKTLKGTCFGIGLSAWPFPRLQARAVLPVESSRLSTPVTLESLSRPGDLEIGASVLGVGSRGSKWQAALDGLLRLPTGVDPSRLNDPILATGRGVLQAGVGAWASETSGRFSFFQWINWEKGGKLKVPAWRVPGFPDGEMTWPDALRAGARATWNLYRRGERRVSLGYEADLERHDATLWNGAVWSSGPTLWYSTGVLRVQVDPRFTVEGRWTFVPTGPGFSDPRPYGDYISAALFYHPVF